MTTKAKAPVRKPRAKKAKAVVATVPANPTYYLVEADDHDHATGGATLLGFWIYLMSDALLFAAIFATFGSTAFNTAVPPGPTFWTMTRLTTASSSVVVM